MSGRKDTHSLQRGGKVEGWGGRRRMSGNRLRCRRSFICMFSKWGQCEHGRECQIEREVATVGMTTRDMGSLQKLAKARLGSPWELQSAAPPIVDCPLTEALYQRVPQLPRVPPEGQATGLGDQRSEVAASALMPWARPFGCSRCFLSASFSCRDKAQTGKPGESSKLPPVSRNGERTRRAFI